MARNVDVAFRYSLKLYFPSSFLFTRTTKKGKDAFSSVSVVNLIVECFEEFNKFKKNSRFGQSFFYLFSFDESDFID